MSNPAVFLDRDGTLIEHFEYLTDPNDVQVMPSVAPGLKLLRDRGFYLVMVTNQSAVARGILTEKKLAEIHNRLKSFLSEQGVYLDRIYHCPYHPEGAVEKYRRESDLRKPSPGMLYLAAKELDIDLASSWIVGDDDRDILAGQAAHCRTILLESYGSTGVHQGQSHPDFRAVNLQEAANLIVRHVAYPTRISPVPYKDNFESKEQPPSVVNETLNNETETIEADEEHFTQDQDESPKEMDSLDEGESRSTLRLILRELQKTNRQQSFTEFSVAKLMAGIFQMIAVFCMVMAFWFGHGVELNPQAVHNSLLWAVLFQLLTVTWFLIHRH
jgi:D-glycero-D-manno-heptose 1,7-bisphosphate phosphatase